MAFWGIEVKPGKPIAHYCEKARGRLRISQATLGIGEATKKTIVQCNVGNRSPVLLCVLLPDKTESCHLDLEFEEADDVVFSVIGPRSVYLTGYYVQRIRQADPLSDTESYGVDIENTQTEGSSFCSDDDKYEDSFINDKYELRVSAQSPVLSSKGMDETTHENDKSKDRKSRGRQLKKKSRVIESDDDANSHENEDEDGYYLPVLKGERAVKTTMSDAEAKIVEMGDEAKSDGLWGIESTQKIVEIGNEAKNDGVCGIESTQKVDPLDINGKLEGVTKPPLNEEGTEVRDEKNELPREVETLEEIIVPSEKVLTGATICANNEKDTIISTSSPTSNEKDQMQSLDLAKPKKKRKQRSNKEKKTCEVQTDNEDHSVLREGKEHDVDASTKMCIDANSVDGHKSKKSRNEPQLEGANFEGIDEQCHNILKDGKFEQGLVHADNLKTDLSAENRENQEKQRLEQICTEEVGTESQGLPKEDKSVQVLLHADSTMEDLPGENGENQDQQIDNIISTINKEILASDSLLEKKSKKKKKKKKDQVKKDLNTGMTNVTDSKVIMPVENEDHTANAAPILKRTLTNGLIIEELASGPPNGKVAAQGKQVKIYYTAMLKESGHVFDSHVKTAFKFRLGDEEFIDGWNVGIDGMRVGDKRRLIIPPSMGFGDDGTGENVPPNSWLVYDVELVGVCK